jgi:hypothetical protein
MRQRSLFARLGLAVSAAGLLIGISAPWAAGQSAQSSPSAASCSPSTVISAFHFTINGVSATTLHGTVHSGDKLEAFFTIAKGCTGIPVTLVSHTMPDAVFVPAHADQQKVFDLATGTFDSGDHMLGPVNVPSCFFQVDFVYGGVHGSGYHVQDHTYSSGTGGTTACTTPAPAVANCTSATGIGVTFSPVTTSSSAATYSVAVTVNGKTTTDSVSVGKSGLTKTYAVPEDAVAAILIKDSAGAPVLNQTVTHDCARPAVSVVDQCAQGSTGGAAVTATNEGSQTKTFTVSKNGTVVDHINVAPYATMTVVEAETEGQTATWVVSGPEGVATAPMTVTHVCTAVLPVVITAPAAPAKAAPQVLAQAGPLATTGSNTGFLLWLSFTLMLLGGLITLASQRVAREG